MLPMPTLRSIIFRMVRYMDVVASKLPKAGGFQPLKGSFSAYQELKNGNLKGHIITEKQSVGPIPSDSITKRCALRQNDFQPWPVFWVVTSDARLIGKSRIWRDANDRYCLEGGYHLQERRRLCEDRLMAQILPGSPRALKGAWTSIASNWGDGRNYYHWLTDNLTRLHTRELLPEPTKVLLPVSTAPYIRESLELLGIASDCASPEETALKPERYYFCSPLAMTGVWNPLGFEWLRKRFSPYFLPSGSGRPIFLTRRSSTRIPDQLEAIESLFLQAGFEIIDCGSISMRQQIEATSAASAIAGIHGAAMTNILWAPPDTPVLELFQPAYLNACYEQIAFQGQLKYESLVLEEVDYISRISSWSSHL
jgi:capsular polysaccharide biosynthesis protein